MSINKIEIQDDNGNVYYPKTSIDSVIYSDKTSIEEKIRILEYRLNELKGQLADSINNKTGSSLTSNSTVDEMTVAINSIKTLEQATADANATAGNILVDKTAYVNGTKITGTMPNKGTSTNTLTLNGSLTLPKGYYDSIKVTQSITTKGSTTDALSQGSSGNYIYTRIPQGAYFTNATSGYPEIKSKFSDIANAIGLTADKLVGTVGGITGTANKYKTATVSITGSATITVPSDGTRLIACFASANGYTNHGRASGFISFKISENNYVNFECKYTSSSTTTAIEPYCTNSTGAITSCKLTAGRDGGTFTRTAYIIYE